MRTKMIKLNDKELLLINNILESDSSKEKTRKKAKVILLKSQGKDINTIIKQTKLSKRTIINYTNQYINAKSKGMFFHYRGKYNQSELNNYIDEIKSEFNEKPPLTYKEATYRISNLTGLNRSETQVRYFLNKHNIYTCHTRAKLRYDVKRKIIITTNKYINELNQQKS